MRAFAVGVSKPLNNIRFGAAIIDGFGTEAAVEQGLLRASQKRPQLRLVHLVERLDPDLMVIDDQPEHLSLRHNSSDHRGRVLSCARQVPSFVELADYAFDRVAGAVSGLRFQPRDSGAHFWSAGETCGVALVGSEPRSGVSL